MFVAVGSAQAASGDVVSCTFEGRSGQLVDDENGTNGIDSINDDRSIDVEHGTYAFRGFRGNCSGYDSATRRPVVANPLVSSNATITSVGEYFNTLCGTAELTDSEGLDITYDLAVAPPTAAVLGVPYSIQLHAGIGTLDILGTSYDGGGAVRAQPLPPGNCVTTDVAEFELSGSFTAVGL